MKNLTFHFLSPPVSAAALYVPEQTVNDITSLAKNAAKKAHRGRLSGFSDMTSKAVERARWHGRAKEKTDGQITEKAHTRVSPTSPATAGTADGREPHVAGGKAQKDVKSKQPRAGPEEERADLEVKSIQTIVGISPSSAASLASCTTAGHPTKQDTTISLGTLPTPVSDHASSQQQMWDAAEKRNNSGGITVQPGEHERRRSSRRLPELNTRSSITSEFMDGTIITAAAGGATTCGTAQSPTLCELTVSRGSSDTYVRAKAGDDVSLHVPKRRAPARLLNPELWDTQQEPSSPARRNPKVSEGSKRECTAENLTDTTRHPAAELPERILSENIIGVEFDSTSDRRISNPDTKAVPSMSRPETESNDRRRKLSGQTASPGTMAQESDAAKTASQILTNFGVSAPPSSQADKEGSSSATELGGGAAWVERSELLRSSSLVCTAEEFNAFGVLESERAILDNGEESKGELERRLESEGSRSAEAVRPPGAGSGMAKRTHEHDCDTRVAAPLVAIVHANEGTLDESRSLSSTSSVVLLEYLTSSE